MPGGPASLLIDHPKVIDVLHEIISPDIRMEGTFYVWRTKGQSAGGLHGGGPQQVDPIFGYRCQNGRIHAGMVRVVFELTAVSKDDGATCFVVGSHKANFPCPFGKTEEDNPMTVPVLAGPGDVIIFSEGMTHGAYPVTNNSVRRSVFFCYMPSINQDNLPQQRMSMYPEHVLERLSDRAHLLTAPGYI